MVVKKPRSLDFNYVLKLVGNILLGIGLTLLTIDTILAVKEVGNSELFGIVSVASGPASGLSLTGLLLIVLTIDALWLLFFTVWLIKKWAHIKDDDNTLYLP